MSPGNSVEVRLVMIFGTGRSPGGHGLQSMVAEAFTFIEDPIQISWRIVMSSTDAV